jgi:hypothetical protein
VTVAASKGYDPELQALPPRLGHRLARQRNVSSATTNAGNSPMAAGRQIFCQDGTEGTLIEGNYVHDG